MQVYAALGRLNALVNTAVRTVLFLYAKQVERLEHGQATPSQLTEHARYPRTLLIMYDKLLLWNNIWWNISTRELQSFFDASVSANHLDVGVGSGYLVSNMAILGLGCAINRPLLAAFAFEATSSAVQAWSSLARTMGSKPSATAIRHRTSGESVRNAAPDHHQ